MPHYEASNICFLFLFKRNVPRRLTLSVSQPSLFRISSLVRFYYLPSTTLASCFFSLPCPLCSCLGHNRFTLFIQLWFQKPLIFVWYRIYKFIFGHIRRIERTNFLVHILKGKIVERSQTIRQSMPEAPYDPETCSLKRFLNFFTI